MDIPYELKEGASVVNGVAQFKQTLKVLFENQIRSFLQSKTIGSRIGIHTEGIPILEEAVRETVHEIPSAEVSQIKITPTGSNKYNVYLVAVYGSNLVEFIFNV